MSSVKLDNLNFYYEISGSGTPLVLISGLSCDSSHWNLIKNMLEQQFEVICLDNRSVGRTQTPTSSYTISDMALDVVKLLNHLGVEKTHILGHSMGGAIAQTIAYENPQLIDKLIISNSFVKIKRRSLIFMENLAKMYLNNFPLEETVPINAPWVFSDQYLNQTNIIDELINFGKTYLQQQPAKGFKQQVEAIAKFNSTDWVNQIINPTLIIAGKNDYLTPLDDSEYMHENINNSQLITQPGAHVPMLEIPERFIKNILPFLLHNS